MSEIVPVRVRVDGTSIGSIQVAGTDIAHHVRRVSFDLRAGDIPQLDLELLPRAFEADAEGRVRVDADTRAVLIALGWTPPGGRS